MLFLAGRFLPRRQGLRSGSQGERHTAGGGGRLGETDESAGRAHRLSRRPPDRPVGLVGRRGVEAPHPGQGQRAEADVDHHQRRHERVDDGAGSEERHLGRVDAAAAGDDPAGVGLAGSRRRALDSDGDDPLTVLVLRQVGDGGGEAPLRGPEAAAAHALGELGAGRDRPVHDDLHLEPVRWAGHVDGDLQRLVGSGKGCLAGERDDAGFGSGSRDRIGPGGGRARRGRRIRTRRAVHGGGHRPQRRAQPEGERHDQHHEERAARRPAFHHSDLASTRRPSGSIWNPHAR